MSAMLEGALIALSGVVVGRFIPGRPKRVPKAPEPPKPICGCTHHKSMHDPKTGKCNAGIKTQKYASGVKMGYEFLPCACLHYEGPIPYEQYYSPEVTP